MAMTTHSGDLAELLAAAEFVRRGYTVSRPLTNGAPYDLLVDLGPSIKRVQVKKSGITVTGAIRIVLSASKSHRGRAKVSYFGRVDCVVAVDCHTSEFFLVHGNDLQSNEIHVRRSLGKNNQALGVRLVDNYSLDAMFPLVLAESFSESCGDTVGLQMPISGLRHRHAAMPQ